MWRRRPRSRVQPEDGLYRYNTIRTTPTVEDILSDVDAGVLQVLQESGVSPRPSESRTSTTRQHRNDDYSAYEEVGIAADEDDEVKFTHDMEDARVHMCKSDHKIHFYLIDEL
jgi:hypothetical protein